MSAFNFAAFKVEAGADQDGQPFAWIVCPHCPGTRSYFPDRHPVTIGDLLNLAWNHHDEKHRDPYLMGDNQ